MNDKIETCKKCNELLTEYAKIKKLSDKKNTEIKIENFLKNSFTELKDVQEYKALFLKYMYIKERLNNNE